MANIINLTAHTTVDLDGFRRILFTSMNSPLEWAFEDYANGHDSFERYRVLMSTSTDMYKYLNGMQALLFAIPEYDIISNSLAYDVMKEDIENVARELAELAREIKW